MLSPGKWHESVPRDPLKNLRWRAFILEKARRDWRVRRELRKVCRQDCLFWVNTFCWTFDPRTPVPGSTRPAAEKTIPFASYPFQDNGMLAILDAVENGQDLVMTKSRDMGATWMALLVMLWMFQFRAGCKFLAISRKENLVIDRSEPDSLFWKIDCLLKYQPGWLKPAITTRKNAYANADNGSNITGEATTTKAGVGGRATAMFIDEFSRIDEGYELLSGTADTTNCRIFNFTSYGNANNASNKLAARKDVKKLALHWSLHPEKRRGLYRYDKGKRALVFPEPARAPPQDYPFIQDGKLRSYAYDAEDRRRANPREMAEMWDMDAQGSQYQFFDAETIGDLQRRFACKPYIEGELEHDPLTGTPIQWHTRPGGPIKLWMQLDPMGRPPQTAYTGGADVSWGTGATNSCASFGDATTAEKVCEIASPFMKPDNFAALCVALCRWLKGNDGQGAYFAWELQGPGVVFGKRVVELGYSPVYYRSNDRTLLGIKTISDTPGWTPTPDTKRVLMEDYRGDLASFALVNRSAEALEECLSIIHLPNGSLEHSGAMEGEDPTGARVNHGDRVVADALMNKLRREKAQAKKAEAPKAVVGSLAWRRRLSEELKQRETSWA